MTSSFGSHIGRGGAPGSLPRHTAKALVLAVLAALALLLAACSSGGDGAEEGSGGSTPAGESGDSQGDDADGPVGSGGVELTSILQLHLVHESDSGDGTSPWGDAEVHMLFEPGGELGVFVFDGENALGRHGTYDLTDGTLTVEVATPDMAFDASVELDLNGPEVEMPFQLFDDAAGTSVWRTEAMGPMGATDMVFQAIRYDDHERVAREDAVERAHDFAAARVESDAGMETDGLDIGVEDDVDWDPPVIIDWEGFENGVTFVFDDDSKASVLLYTFGPEGDAPSLSPAPFAGDPRVELPTEVPGSSSSDPPNKTAVLLNPFATEFGEEEAVDAAVHTLEERGYSVVTRSDDEATFEAFVETLTDGGSPGLVTVSTHGGANGELATGEKAGTTRNWFTEWMADRKLKAAAARIVAAYPSAKTFEVGGELDRPYRAIRISSGGVGTLYVGLSPSFWKWLHEEQKADFTESFVFLSACESDKNPEVREDVNAAVFMGFSEQASVRGGTAVFSYLIEQLARPTRSVEEAHYNLIRVINTQQTIFEEDGLLATGGTEELPDILKVYSGGDYNPVSYEGRGFLDTSRNLGQIWWLTYSGRWSGDAAEGSEKLKNCWEQFWSQGNMGGLGSPACNASNVGSVPTEEEVGYARYLLTGDESLVVGSMVPRWTLADGG